MTPKQLKDALQRAEQLEAKATGIRKQAELMQEAPQELVDLFTDEMQKLGIDPDEVTEF